MPGMAGRRREALLNGPFDLGFDADGNLYFSDTFNHCIRRVEARYDVITTCAGCGEAGYSGDGGAAMRARFNEPYGIAVDRAANIYVADRHNHCVRRVDAASGIVTTFAGNGSSGFSGDGGAASRAGMVEPNGLALDPAQNRLFIADVADHRVRVVDLASGIIWTFAGTGEAEHSGDGGPAQPPGSMAPAPSRSPPTERSTFSSGRAARCARRSPHRHRHDHRRHRRQGLFRRRRTGGCGSLRRTQRAGDRPPKAIC